MTKRIGRILAVWAGSWAICFSATAQIVVDDAITPEQMATILVGQNVGIENVSVTAADRAWGYYQSTNTVLGDHQGLLLTTGQAKNAIGPNDETGLPVFSMGACQNCDEYENDLPDATNFGNDLLEQTQGGGNTFDAALFEFDIRPQGDSLKFDFTFASEEYNEWVGSSFNDIFGFYITGPNIATPLNIAIVPGTNDFVAINTVNDAVNSEFWNFTNDVQPAGGPGQGIQYDGFTIGLSAQIGGLIPCEEYHLQLVIADRSDRIYDSAVFIESIESNFFTVSSNTDAGVPYMVEGCNAGQITFSRPQATNLPDDVMYWLEGTAQTGTDYTPNFPPNSQINPLTATIPAGQTSVTIPINPIADGIPEGSESIVVFLFNPSCTEDFVSDSLIFEIRDEIEVSLTADEMVICPNECVNLSGVAETGGNSAFSWDPVDQITDPTLLNTQICPDNTTTVTLTSMVSTCEASASVVIEVDPIDIQVVSSNSNCQGTPSGSATANPQEGIAPFSFAWTGPLGFTANTATIENLIPGNYCVVVTDATGCTGEICIDIIQENALEISDVAFSDFTCFPISCNGAEDGSISLTISGGDDPYTISWNDADNTTGPFIDGLGIGTYVATVIDDNGCEVVGEYTLTQPDPLVVTLVGTIDVLCTGDQTGVATVSTTGGCGDPSFVWSHDPNLEAAVANNLPSGGYTVSATDINGCASDDDLDIQIGVPLDPLVVVLDNQSDAGNGFNLSCSDSEDGFANITASGLTGNPTFAWFVGGEFEGGPLFSMDEDPINFGCGLYHVVVTDDQCEVVVEVNFTCPPPIAATAIIDNNPCGNANNADGCINITATGGTGGFMYSWTGPNNFTANTEDICNLVSGDYTVTITDASGCVRDFVFSITNNDGIQIAPVATLAGCAEECNGTIMLNVTSDGTIENIIWTGPTAIADGTQNPTGLCEGIYTVTITDDNGCELIESITISTQPAIEIMVEDIVNPLCEGSTTGSITISVSGGTGTLEVNWLPVGLFPGSNQLTISNLTNNVYTVVVTDDLGCETTLDVEVTAPQALMLSINSPTETASGFIMACNGDTDGVLEATVSGGTPDFITYPDTQGYMFDWSNSTSPFDVAFVNNDSLPGVGEGTVIVIVTDANGCVATTTAPIAEPEPVEADGNIIPASCDGVSCTGSIDATPTGGNSGYMFNWDGFTNQNGLLENLCEGTYTLTITDALGCEGTEDFDVPVPDPIEIDQIIISPASCFGNNDGAINVTATGGFGVYCFTLNGGACTDGNFDNLTAGIYTLNITDQVGCEFETEIEVPGANNFDVEINVAGGGVIFDLACNTDTASVILVIEGGTGPLDTLWTVEGTPIGSQPPAVLVAGNYCVELTDSLGCIATDCTVITAPDEALVVESSVFTNADGFNISCFGACDGAIDLTVSGGVMPYTFIWRDDNLEEISNLEDLTDLCAGDYEVLVTDGNNCFVNLEFTLTEPTEIIITPNTVSPLCPGDGNGSVNVLIEGGCPGYTFEWDNPALTTLMIDNLAGGEYVLTVTDSKNCIKEETIIIADPQPIAINASIDLIECNGDGNGAITLNPTGGTDPFNYEWTGPNSFTSSAASISNLQPGEYCVLLLDDNDCEADTCITLIDPPVFELSILSQDATCGDANGSFSVDTVSGSGGVPPLVYNYDQFTDPTDEELQSLFAGNYTGTVVDAHGCALPFDITIGGPEAILIDGTVTNPVCGSENDGTIEATVTNGTGVLTYSWTNASGEEIGTALLLTDLAGGDYSLTVIDEEACTETQTFTVNQPPIIAAEFDLSEYTFDDFPYNVSEEGATDGIINTTLTGGTLPLDIDWTGPDGFEASTVDLNDLAAGAYTLTVTDGNGCMGIFDTLLTEPFDIQLPTGITPNGDGFNDNFVILGIERVPQNTIRVYNRWGNLVYEKNNYNNEWDGENQDGEPLSDGTYYVVFEARNQEFNTYVDLRR